MKEKMKNIPLLGRKMVSAYSWYLRMHDAKFLKKNRGLKNKFTGKRVFVIATGPSIKKQDLKKLTGELCISVSNFFVHPDFNVIKPAYHVFAPSHPPITTEQYGALLKDAEAHFPEGQNVFVSISDKHIIEKFNVFKKQNVYYYSQGHKPLRDKIDFTKSIPAIQTSPHIAMYLAFYLGAAEICLLGCDHDWILHLSEATHFYEEKNSALSRSGYNEAWQRSGDYQTEFEDYVKLWKRYKDIRSYAAKRNVKIFNCTPQSFLDVFPRKNMEDVLEEKTNRP